jgi:hypothetical protein
MSQGKDLIKQPIWATQKRKRGLNESASKQGMGFWAATLEKFKKI